MWSWVGCILSLNWEDFELHGPTHFYKSKKEWMDITWQAHTLEGCSPMKCEGCFSHCSRAEDPAAVTVSLSNAPLYRTPSLPFQSLRTSSEGSSATPFSFMAAFHSLCFTCLVQTGETSQENRLQCKHMSFNSFEIGVAWSQPFFCLQCRRPKFSSWVRKISWRREHHTLQYSCLENSIHRTWQDTVHGMTRSQK